MVIYDKARVISRTNYDSPGQRWLPKLVLYKIESFQNLQKLQFLFFLNK